jgi:alanine dehydrogenase
MVETMKPGTVIVDVAVDQGGCVETSRPTTHSDPVFDVNGVIQYCVANVPGAVPRTSTYALSNVTLPFAQKLADLGFVEAVRRDQTLARGVNVCRGEVVFHAVAEALGLASHSLEELIG